MIKAVIYESGTGFSKRYAELYAAKLELPCVSLKDAAKQVEKGAEAVFFGWVFANKIKGLKSACKKWKLVCAVGVGMSAPSAAYRDILEQNNSAGCPLFYVRGGLDTNRLRGLNKVMLKMVEDGLTKENKPDNSEMIQILRNGGDFVSEDNLAEIIAFTLDKI